MSRTLPSLALVAGMFAGACTDSNTSTEYRHSAPPPTASLVSTVSTVDGQTLAEIRAATAHYQRIDDAIADGFVRGSACISSVFGGKGYTYQKPVLFDGIVDPAAPEILNYEPMKNGRMRLVSVAFLVPAASWDPFHPTAPTLGDQSFLDRRVAGSFGPPFANYALYASVWRNNPRGMFDQYNPDVSCDFAADAVIELIRATSMGRSVYPIGNTPLGGQGQAISGISCISGPAPNHLHAHLSLFLRGEQIEIPQGAQVYYRGNDDHAGPLTKYALKLP